MLLHARCGPSGSPLVNGTTVTVTGVDSDGLAVRLDGGGQAAVLPTAFVQGARKDGSPNVSHAWARTVDGAQGGTWEACHLLGSSALDAYRGYTGQSRSRQPTHTWNTAKVARVDHGGGLADRRGRPSRSLLRSAVSPTHPGRPQRPLTLDQQLHDLIVEHERVLATRPADCASRSGGDSRSSKRPRSTCLIWRLSAAHTAERLASLGRLSALAGGTARSGGVYKPG